MADTGFTPGPWQIGARATFASISANVGGHERAIARVPHVSWMTAEVANANAELIAAAPDMYEALLDIRNRILCPVGPTPSPSQVLEIASIALAKARGERA